MELKEYFEWYGYDYNLFFCEAVSAGYNEDEVDEYYHNNTNYDWC